jgi:hypothetical protein
MHEIPEESRVIAERHDDGQIWPLLALSDAAEATQLVKDLRARGRNVDAIEVHDDAVNQLVVSGARTVR